MVPKNDPSAIPTPPEKTTAKVAAQIEKLDGVILERTKAYAATDNKISHLSTEVASMKEVLLQINQQLQMGQTWSVYREVVPKMETSPALGSSLPNPGAPERVCVEGILPLYQLAFLFSLLKHHKHIAITSRR